MNLDVEIYMSNVIKFFNENPKDLLNFVSLERKDEFFNKIKEVAEKNAEKGEEIVLTQQQFIDICLIINDKPHLTKNFIERTHTKTDYGYICWN
jgi:hypothetical protein